MKSDDIEKALRRLLGDSVGPEGIVITLRRHDEYEQLIARIEALEAQESNYKRQISQMSEYANLYLFALDELREARKILQRLGVDTSFIHSLRRK